MRDRVTALLKGAPHKGLPRAPQRETIEHLSVSKQNVDTGARI